ncbi:MAG: metallophosphoesterase [Clostridia bacterium]|nr:metallophosphoesterase [Clostridia bacterium]
MYSELLVSTAAAVATVAVGVIAAAAIVFTACFMQTKKLKVTRLYADRYAEVKKPAKLRKNKKTDQKTDAYPPANSDKKDEEALPLCRIGLISDLHFPMLYVNTDDVIFTLAKEDCDLIAVTGDLCQNAKGKTAMLAFMKKLSESLKGVPILVVPGNHDVSYVCKKDPLKIQEYFREVESCGGNIKVLRNETASVELKGSGSRIIAAGFDEKLIGDKNKYIGTFEKALSEAGEKDKLLLLMHNPDIMEHVSEAVKKGGKYSVALAGHTHGGQVYIPFNLEFELLRDDSLPRKGFVYGLYEYCENNRLYITCGLGQSLLPVRLGTVPEIAFICF